MSAWHDSAPYVVRGRWPTQAEVGAHPLGEDLGLWVMIWDDGYGGVHPGVPYVYAGSDAVEEAVCKEEAGWPAPATSTPVTSGVPCDLGMGWVSVGCGHPRSGETVDAMADGRTFSAFYAAGGWRVPNGARGYLPLDGVTHWRAVAPRQSA